MSGNTKTSVVKPHVNYATHAEIQRTGYLSASRLPPVDSDAHETVLSTFRAAANRAPNYDVRHAVEEIVDLVLRHEGKGLVTVFHHGDRR